MIKKAVAIKYNRKYKAPKVVAIGAGQIAEKIIEKANVNAVPIIENDELAAKLSVLKVDQEIPIELYEAVAEIVAYIYSIDRSMKD